MKPKPLFLSLDLPFSRSWMWWVTSFSAFSSAIIPHIILKQTGNLWRQEGYMSVKYCKWCTFSGKFWKVEDFPNANYLTNSIAVFTWVIRKLLMETIDYRPTINGKFMKKSMKNEIFTHNKNAAGILRPYEIHIWKRMIFSFLSYFSMADFFCEHYKWVWAKEKSVTDISS